MRLFNGAKNRWLVLTTLGALLVSNLAIGLGSEESSALLEKAYEIKSSNHLEFVAILDELKKDRGSLSVEQQTYLDYLDGWKSAYEGEYHAAIDRLKPIADGSGSPTLRLRAAATMTNVLVLSSQYEQAFTRLNGFLSILPQVSDKEAREQALFVAAYVYVYVGEYELSLRYAQALVDENWKNRGACLGGQLKLQTRFKSGNLKADDPELLAVIDACDRIGESIRASAVRTYLATLFMNDGRVEAAKQVLTANYDKTRLLHSPQIVSDYDSLLAQIYMQLGDRGTARQYALRAIDDGVKNEFTEPLVNAYRILYEVAKQKGDQTAALAFHEKYATADKGYLDDTTARQIAYQRVRHEVAEGKLQIEALNRQNEVLKLQRQLSDKALENVRLYIVLSTVVLAFILLWAYKTKRSQMHFMKLSRQDGLTGIFNRPHFIDQSTRALNAAKKSGQSICVVICDLDYFKAINDNCGHATGDAVLKQTATAFQARLQKNDIVGRLGGEEFGLLFVGCDLAEARQRCEQLRTVLAEIVIDESGSRSKLSASFGIAATTSSGHDFRQLLAHADAALYCAKRRGRDRVVLHGEDTVAPSVEIDAERLSA